MRKRIAILALLLAACVPAAPVIYPTPGPIMARDAATIVAQATDAAAGTATAQAEVVWAAAATSTAVANAATAAALTPTAQAIALAMAAAQDRATATAQAAIDRTTMTPAAATAQAAATGEALARQATQTQAAGVLQAFETEVVATEQAERRAEQHQNNVQAAERWGRVVDAVTAIVVGVLVCGAVVLVVWLRLLSLEHVAHEAARVEQARAQALVTMLARSGNMVLRYNQETGQWEAVPALPPPDSARTSVVDAVRHVQETPHIPIIESNGMRAMDMSGRPDHRGEVIEFLQRVVDYQAQHDYPRNRIPRWDKLGLGGGDRWSRLVGYLKEHVTINPPGQAKGTYVAGRYTDVEDLLQRILGGSVVPA
jgi:hypothetical protein